MPHPDPNAAFLLIVGGILLIYIEFIWVGKVVFGVTGAIAALIGIASLLQVPHSTIGCVLIGAAIICFLCEANFETFWLAGILGGVFWAFGFWKLGGISPHLIFPVSALFAAVTTWLLNIAKQARRNKRVT